MTRLLPILSSAVLCVVGAQAQCYTNGTTSVTAGLVQWSSGSGYASTFPVGDEGITNPPISLAASFPGGFPMAGAVGTLDQMWVNSNGEVYLSDSTLGLLQPAGGASFGVNTLAEARGPAGGSPRIFPLGGDNDPSDIGVWDITVDQAPGICKVSWIDMARLANTTDLFSFSCTLLAGGAVEFSYSNTFPTTGFTGRYVGLSIGNLAGTATSPSRNLTGGCAGSDTGTEGLIYQNFSVSGQFNSLAGRTILITPNGSGGYCSNVTCQPAENVSYGTGCHTFVGPNPNSNLFELFLDVPAAKAALDGNAIQFTKTANGYTANWLPGAAGALYVRAVGHGDDRRQRGRHDLEHRAVGRDPGPGWHGRHLDDLVERRADGGCDRQPGHRLHGDAGGDRDPDRPRLVRLERPQPGRDRQWQGQVGRGQWRALRHLRRGRVPRRHADPGAEHLPVPGRHDDR